MHKRAGLYVSRSTGLAATQVGQRENASSNQPISLRLPTTKSLLWEVAMKSIARNLKLRLMKHSWLIQHRQIVLQRAKGAPDLKKLWPGKNGVVDGFLEANVISNMQAHQARTTWDLLRYLRGHVGPKELFDRTQTRWLSLLLAARKLFSHIKNVHKTGNFICVFAL